MPFDKPSDGGGGFASELLEDGSWYVLKCMDIDDTEPGQYGPRMRWTFNLQHEGTGEVVTTDNGDVFDWWVNTSTQMTPKAYARRNMEAFLGREVTPDDDPEELSNECIGKKARALIVINERGYAEISKIQPLAKASAKAGGKSTGRRAAAAVAEADEDGEEDAPF